MHIALGTALQHISCPSSTSCSHAYPAAPSPHRLHAGQAGLPGLPAGYVPAPDGSLQVGRWHGWGVRCLRPAPGRVTQPQQHGALCSWRWMHVTNACDCPARTLQGLAVEAALPPGAAGKPVVSGGALPKWLGWHVVGICLRQSRSPCLPGMPCILCLLLSQHTSPPATDGAGPWAVAGDLHRPVWSL